MNSVAKRMKKAKSRNAASFEEYGKIDERSTFASPVNLSDILKRVETTDSEETRSTTSSGSSINTGAVEKTKTNKKGNIADDFVPKPNKRVDRVMGHIESDDDIWVERIYVNEKGSRISYYRSVRTNRCIWLEPPTGAGTLVYQTELKKFPDLLEFALGPLDRPVTEIEKPDFFGPSYREQKKEERKLVGKKRGKTTK